MRRGLGTSPQRVQGSALVSAKRKGTTMPELAHDLLKAVLTAAGMFWQVGWTLVFGFIVSAMLQTLVSRDRVVAALGRGGVREIALATAAGAASSSCSYAAAAVSRTLFGKGAALGPTLAFLFASTNLVVELGAALLLLLGWQFTLGEWVGGVVLIAILSVLVRWTAPKHLVDEARKQAQAGSGGHAHGGADAAGGTWSTRLRQRDTWILIAQNFASDWRMLWWDLLLGFAIAGALAAFVPGGVWRALFVTGAPPLLQVPANALLGPLVAMLSFVCSIGNVPMAAVLWGSGVSFGGVLAFLFADLLVLPLLDVYRRHYGWKMAAYLAGVFYATMVGAAIVMDAAFALLGIVPHHLHGVAPVRSAFALDATFFLDLAALAGTVALFRLSRRAPTRAAHCCH